MPQSFSQIYIHLVFSTKERYPFLRDPAVRNDTHRYLAGILKNHDCTPIEIGGVTDHVHLLFTLPRTRALADIIKETKRASTLHLRQSTDAIMKKFSWQTGYGAFSVSASNKEAVQNYIQSQEEHHKTTTFQDEYRKLLLKHGIEYDEQYLWG